MIDCLFVHSLPQTYRACCTQQHNRSLLHLLFNTLVVSTGKKKKPDTFLGMDTAPDNGEKKMCNCLFLVGGGGGVLGGVGLGFQGKRVGHLSSRLVCFTTVRLQFRLDCWVYCCNLNLLCVLSSVSCVSRGLSCSAALYIRKSASMRL